MEMSIVCQDRPSTTFTGRKYPRRRIPRDSGNWRLERQGPERTPCGKPVRCFPPRWESLNCTSAGTWYITSMKRPSLYIVFSLLAAGWILSSASGQHRDRHLRISVIGLPDRMETPVKPAGSVPQPYIIPGNKPDLTTRVAASPSALLTTHRHVNNADSVHLPDDPLPGRFRKGVYHRYRPRDPTTAWFSPPK